MESQELERGDPLATKVNKAWKMKVQGTLYLRYKEVVELGKAMGANTMKGSKRDEGMGDRKMLF